MIEPDMVFAICQNIYKEYGIDLRFPKARDVKKTYQYRYLVSICKKFSNWNFDDKEVNRFLRIAIGNSFRQKTINKGLSALHQKNLLDISYEQMISSMNDRRQVNNTFESIMNFLEKYCSGSVPLEVLKKRDNLKANMAITNLYQAGKINVEFLSVNDLCRQIVIEAIDRESQDALFLPSLGKIYRINKEISSDRDRFTNYSNAKKWGIS